MIVYVGDTLRQVQDFKKLYNEDGLADALHRQSICHPTRKGFFMHMILMDSKNDLAMSLGETYIVNEKGNERLGNQRTDLVIL